MAQLALEVLGDGQAYVEADDVGRPQRADRVPVAEHHGGVDVGRGGHPLLEHPHRLEGDRDPEPAAREAR